jgi:hypothetical protein
VYHPTYGCSEEEVSSLWRLLATLLHLGNLEFQPADDMGPFKTDIVSPKVRPVCVCPCMYLRVVWHVAPR